MAETLKGLQGHAPVENIGREKRDGITISRRGLAFGAAGLVAAGFGVNQLLSRQETAVIISTGDGEQNPGVGADTDPTAEPTLAATEEALIEQGGDVAMADFRLNRLPNIYREGETTPETYLGAYDEHNPSKQPEIKKMFQLPGELLEGREEHTEYVDAVMELLGDAAKPSRTEQEVMKYMLPEFFADRTGMNPDQRVALKAEIDLAIDEYVNAGVDKYTDAIYEGMIMTDILTDKYTVSGYNMLVEIRRAALRKFAEHVVEHKNMNWNMSFSASNREEDIHGETVFVTANLAINAKGWSSDGEVVSDATENAKVFFAGESKNGLVAKTKFNAEYSEDGSKNQSVMDALAAF